MSWSNSFLNLEYGTIFLVFLSFNILRINIQFKNQVKNFNKLRLNEAKRIEQENIVSQLLPFHVIYFNFFSLKKIIIKAFEKLKQSNVNKMELTDDFQDVTLLFADIANFTKYSASVRPAEVVLMLRQLFTEFDKICVKHHVYKLYTIGDCYVVMGFINANHRNPVCEADNVVKMALSMIDIIRKVRKVIGFDELDMRIGIHTVKN